VAAGVEAERVDLGLAAYVPAVLDEWLVRSPDARHLPVDGSLLFTDLSGFTALNERLSKRGKIGAEVMAGVITSVFTELLSVAALRGGDMLKFGGDAMLLLFTGEGHLRRAALAAAGMQARLRQVGRIDTGAGIVKLRMSAGLHTGRVDLFLVGESHRDVVCAGPAATTTCAMEGVADAGEVLLSPAAAAGLGESWLAAPKGPGILLGRTPRPSVADLSLVERLPYDAESFVPVAIRAHVAGGGHQPEHRLVTVSFVNFQGIDDDLEAERFDLVTDRLHAAISHAQEVYDRYEVSFLATDVGKDGTKIMAATGTPRALGEDEDRMLLAALELVQGDHGLRVHVGVNRGHAFAGDVGPTFRRTYTVLGDTTNTAARVMAKAEPFQVLATPAVLEHAATRFALDVIPPFAAKGKAKPLVAYGLRQVLGAADRGDSDGRPTELVGRTAERRRFRDLFGAARKGVGQELQLVAEPGLGKSTLLATALGDQPLDRVVTAACGPYGQATAYFAVRLLLADALDRPERPLAALRDRVVAADRSDLLAWLPLLRSIFDEPIEPTREVEELAEQFRRPRLHLLITELLDLLLPGPSALVVEDVHWADDASAQALATLAAAVGHRPWVLVTTRRPGGSGYLAAGDAEVIALEPLDEEALRDLARATASHPLRPSVLDDLLARSGGNPLFLQELVRAADAGGSASELPDSIEALLAVRIDRLDRATKTALRYASVLGLRVDEALLGEVVQGLLDAPPDVWDQAQEFIERADGVLRFRHALVRDAAYEALPFATRVELHRRAAARYVERGGPVDLIALHYARADEPAAAWRYAVEAARAAVEKLAHAEAIEFYRLAVEAARAATGVVAPDALAAVLESLGDSCEVAGRYEEAASAYRSSRKLAPAREGLLRKEGELRERTGRYSDALRWYRRAMHDAEGAEFVKLSLAYAGVRIRQGRLREAVRWAEPALREAEALGDEAGIAHASYLLHLALTWLGLPDRVAYRERAVPIYERRGDHHALAKALNNLGIDAYYEGEWDEALSFWTRSREAMLRVGDEVGGATLSNNIGEILSDQGLLGAAEELFREARDVCLAANSPSVAAIALKNSGRVLSRRRCFREARAVLDQALEEFLAIGQGNYIVETKLYLVECDVAEGRHDEALSRLAALGADAAATPHLEAMALRLKGIALAGCGDRPAALAALVSSRDVGQAAAATYEVAVTSFVLADLAGDEPGREEALALLKGLGVAGDAVLAAPAPPAAR
jgi:class 3 adenylate cyclase/tetratricopeptide (TPR) repeat protein